MSRKGPVGFGRARRARAGDPARQEDLAIDLAPECDQIMTRALPRFTELRTHVYEQIQRAKRGEAIRPTT